MTGTRKTIARILAVLALAAAAIAVYLVINSVSGSDGDAGPTGTTKAAKTKQKKSNEATQNTRKAYVVKEGDTLTGISEETGVPIDKIESLNPDLDPQALQAGQKLKLR